MPLRRLVRLVEKMGYINVKNLIFVETYVGRDGGRTIEKKTRKMLNDFQNKEWYRSQQLKEDGI